MVKGLKFTRNALNTLLAALCFTNLSGLIMQKQLIRLPVTVTECQAKSWSLKNKGLCIMMAQTTPAILQP